MEVRFLRYRKIIKTRIMRTHTTFESARRYARNIAAAHLNLYRAFGRRDIDRVLSIIVRMSLENVWLLCIIAVLVSLVAGFFKPHCFVTAFLLFICSGIIRGIIEGERCTKN